MSMRQCLYWRALSVNEPELISAADESDVDILCIHFTYTFTTGLHVRYTSSQNKDFG